MKFTPQTYACSVMHTVLVLMAATLVLPQGVHAECLEYKIVEYEDRVEAVCVGELLTEAQKKAKLEEEKRQEAETQHQRAEELRLLKEINASNRAKAEAEADAERKKQQDLQPVTQPPPVTKNKTTNPQLIYK